LVHQYETISFFDSHTEVEEGGASASDWGRGRQRGSTVSLGTDANDIGYSRCQYDKPGRGVPHSETLDIAFTLDRRISPAKHLRGGKIYIRL